MAATARALSPTPTDRVDTFVKPNAATSPLWLCAYFPDLALAALHLDLDQAVACSAHSKGQTRLYAVSEPARQAGVEPGMAPAAALALCPGLSIRNRDPLAERQALQQLAEIALDFSPWVSLDQPDCLLLEIRSCLTLFGGIERLQDKLRTALQTARHHPLIAISPSPTASVLLARLSLETIVTDRQALRSALGPLPVAALELDDKILHRLFRTGIRQLTDLWRLPRDGLAKRYGAVLLQQLDRLAGQQTQILQAFHRPPSFQASREMPIELERIEHFFPAVEQLAGEFAAFLKSRDATTLGISLQLHHYDLPATRLTLDFRAGSRDPKHWCGLLYEKLERSPLPAPVLALTLLSAAIIPFQPERFSLFDDSEQPNSETEWQAVLDQLQARLGHHALKFPGTQADHRPERAMTNTPSLLNANPGLPLRPLWLLPNPAPLRLGDICLLSAAERIESGWWDDQSMRRDYYIGKDAHGRKLWVYRDLNAKQQWFLHGLFG
ncbi:Y-family DNA polymerase [Methylomonas rosea]|uniref:DNA polymerase Y family protein n=1 Tax=Methylomonas rosea TaxID=2952227 RepID=A0ABT1TTL9_9GAMM|nr:DNA polymerase Y family protein [Methylomonas sp. WSC-7]MCQ8117408.1 DNA polymerase Y family protein [Methylomonas sp. WSC-7]